MIIKTDFTKRYEKIPVDIFEDADVAGKLVAGNCQFEGTKPLLNKYR